MVGDSDHPPLTRTLLLSAGSMVRQQSDTTGTRNRLVRSSALEEEDRPTTSQVSKMASVKHVTMSPNLNRSTRVVSNNLMQSGKCGSYMELKQYRLMEEIGQLVKEKMSSRVDREKLNKLKTASYITHPPKDEENRTLKRRGAKKPVDPNKNKTLQKRVEFFTVLCLYRMGSYGIVKLAMSKDDQKLYALKVLDKGKILKNYAFFRPPPGRKNKPAPSNPLQMVQKEIAILKKLNHPNVVNLVEVLDDPEDNYLYMVFEYVEKGSILDIPTSEPLDEDTAWKYFRETLKGVEYLHHQKIVHRDIKPSNILLSEAGDVKIADFGVSCEFEGIDAFLSGTAGTPAFMAPEALTEESNYFYSGRAHDIWSLGITLYAFVIGKVPFWDAYIIALHKKIRNDPVIFPDRPHISDLCKDLILLLLNKDPGLRPMLHEVKEHSWVTRYGLVPMPSEMDNCHLVTVTDEEIASCVRVVPRLDTLILVKAMGHRKRFGNPFRNAPRNTLSVNSMRDRRKSSSVKDSKYVPSAVSTSTLLSPKQENRPSSSVEIELSGLQISNNHNVCTTPRASTARE